MKKIIFSKKYILVSLAVLSIFLIIFVFLKTKSKKNTKTTSSQKLNESVIPTIDSSVKINLTQISNGKEVILSIRNMPSNTNSIDYELSYQTVKQGLQGVIGTINLEDSQVDYEKKITLGTCSSGTCVYHQVIGKIKLNLKFNGDYGEKFYEKEYSL